MFYCVGEGFEAAIPKFGGLFIYCRDAAIRLVGLKKEGGLDFRQAVSHLLASRVKYGGSKGDPDAGTEQLLGLLDVADETVYHPRRNVKRSGVPSAQPTTENGERRTGFATHGDDLVHCSDAVDYHRFLQFDGDFNLPSEELYLLLPVNAAGLVEAAFADDFGSYKSAIRWWLSR